MKKIIFPLLIVFTTLFSIISCGKKSEDYSMVPLQEYYPLQVGKWYLYRLDSTILAPFGTALIQRSYQAKDTVEASFTDNLGRISFRIFRLVRDTAGLQPWRPAATYTATPTGKTIEYIDNNLRFIKLSSPVIEGTTWKAHSFIDTKSATSLVPYLDEWEYEYRDLNMPFQLFNNTYDSTVTVFQHDENTPEGAFDKSNYYQHNNGYEVYAKGVGLVYKEFLHWTWDINPPPAKYVDGSYGIKLRLISHN